MSTAQIGDNELARATGVPQSTITRIANGTTKDAKEERLKPLADYFGVSTAQLRGAEPLKGAPRTGEPRPSPQDLTPEAVQVARLWMQISPGRRTAFLMEMSWARFFESKFPTYRIGVADAESYDKFERSVEADWARMMRQANLPL